MKRSFSIAMLVAVPIVMAAGPASSREMLAAPEIAIFYGDLLPSRVAIGDYNVNHRWLIETVRLRADQRPLSSELQERASIRVALFWGSEWRIRAHRDSLRVLAPERANQHAVMYPAIGTRRALLDLNGLHALTDSGLALLHSRGIPIRVP